VMPDKFKKSDYVSIVRDIVPEVDKATNPLDLGKVAEFPSLKNIVLLGDKKVNGMLNYTDLETLYTEKDEVELAKRE
jgi:hypothetical protein